MRQSGVDLTKNPLADALRGCDSPNAIPELLQDKADAFKNYRDGDRTLIKWLKKPVVHGFSGVLGPAISLVQDFCYLYYQVYYSMTYRKE
jgi:hypothetical protein